MYVQCTDVYIHICTYLWCLTQGVIQVSRQHNFTELVQNAMGLFKIPLGLSNRVQATGMDSDVIALCAEWLTDRLACSLGHIYRLVEPCQQVYKLKNVQQAMYEPCAIIMPPQAKLGKQ
jgi:hypothetical protein